MRTIALLLVAVALLLDAAAPARADEFKPGYLQLTQVDRETYDVLWKIPAIDESTTLKVKPQFPAGSEVLTPARSTFSRGVTVVRWRIRVPGGLDGRRSPSRNSRKPGSTCSRGSYAWTGPCSSSASCR